MARKRASWREGVIFATPSAPCCAGRSSTSPTSNDGSSPANHDRELLGRVFASSMKVKGKTMLARRMSDPDVEEEYNSLSEARKVGIENIVATDPQLSDGFARVIAWETFEQRKLLGEGEFATAYASSLDGAAVAIKVLKADKHGSETAVRGLKREIMLLSLIEHPNTMRAIGLGQHDNQPFMVMPRRSEEHTSELQSP